MSRDYLPVLCAEDVSGAIEDLQAEIEGKREALGDGVVAQVSHVIATARIEALHDAWKAVNAVKSFKVLKNNLEEDDQKYYVKHET